MSAFMPPAEFPALGLALSLAKLLPDYLTHLGLPTQPIWDAYGLSPEVVPERTRVPAVRVLAALRVASDLTGDPHVAVHAARSIRPHHLGCMGYLLMSCPHVAQALLLCEHYQVLVNNEFICHHQVRHHQIEIKHEAMSNTGTVDAPYWWFLVTARLAFARWVFGNTLLPLGIDLPCPHTAHAAGFEQFVGAPVRYDMPDCIEVFPAAARELANPQADAHLYDLVQGHAAQQLLSLGSSEQEALARARAAVAEALTNGEALTLSSLVAKLRQGRQASAGTSPRQLQKHLSANGLPFKALVEEVRRDLALRQLREGTLPISAIALSSGYTEPSSFNRAVRRWTGLTPTEIRGRAMKGDDTV